MGEHVDRFWGEVFGVESVEKGIISVFGWFWIGMCLMENS